MKQIYSIFISAALLLNVGLTSCDSFLTETPQGELTEANAFTSIKDAEALIISCYDGIQKGHEEYYMWYYMILADCLRIMHTVVVMMWISIMCSYAT